MPPTPPLPTLYKARGLSTKQPVCAICVERTRGRTEQVRLGYGVGVWLCAGHASREFQTRRGGRDFVRTLSGVWKANGCLTARAAVPCTHTSRASPAPRPGPGPGATRGPPSVASSRPPTPAARGRRTSPTRCTPTMQPGPPVLRAAGRSSAGRLSAAGSRARRLP